MEKKPYISFSTFVGSFAIIICTLILMENKLNQQMVQTIHLCLIVSVIYTLLSTTADRIEKKLEQIIKNQYENHKNINKKEK